MIFQVGAGFQTGFRELQKWGFADVILPFLLFFALLFAVLQKVRLFGKQGEGEKWEPDRKLNGVVAFVIAMMIVLPHILGLYKTFNPILFLNNILPASAVIIFLIVIVLLLIGMTGQSDMANARIAQWAGFAGIAVLLIVFLSNLFPNVGLRMGFMQDPKIQSLVIVIAIFAVVVWLVVGGGKKDKEGSFIQRLWGLEK